MKISVIIAAYNAEKYIRSALDSILTQTLASTDYEVIVVNDGSSDSTESILEEYQAQHQNLYYYTQKNKGPATARNLGLKHAKGDYLYFFDADDIVDQDALTKLYDKAEKEKADVVIARYDIFNEYTISAVTNINKLTKTKSISKYDPRLMWTFTLWNKLFRRKLVSGKKITFPSLSYSEDGVFTMRVILNAKKITGLDYIVLHYRRNYDLKADSITASISPWKIQHFKDAHEMIRQSIIDAIRRDYPEYRTFEETLQKESTAALFYHEFEVKELQTIYNQFYSHYWTSDTASRDSALERLEWKLTHVSYATKQEILDRNPELLHFRRNILPKELAAKARINVCLFGTPDDKDDFLAALSSIRSSNYVSYRITMPRNMKKYVKESHLDQENYSYILSRDKERFYKKAAEKYPTEYVLFTESGFLYTYNALTVALKKMDAEDLDYCSESVYCWNETYESFLLGSSGSYFPYSPSDFSIPKKEKSDVPNTSSLTRDEQIALLESSIIPETTDGLLANKLFKSSFILPLLTLPYEKMFSKMYKTGYHAFLNHQSVLLTKSSTDAMSLCKREDI